MTNNNIQSYFEGLGMGTGTVRHGSMTSQPQPIAYRGQISSFWPHFGSKFGLFYYQLQKMSQNPI